ncbi:MAG: phosphate ABC transporter permease [Kaistia sp. SCN 65-12]|jgi:lipopolysaccharide transport system permease protein|uniref:ABC transporter permease n=1 Tax=Reyranella massiliensis TaxID=445220 RepID=UPI0002EED564|nr:ABC transporter permease [Reyranella massiliensis]MCA0245321.1 ABC transporter permease [Pseudomonadota bacterium]ODT21729.1 MAG: phosphate ABC transporter permease [Kaistia sp. SCN 65-12]
MNDQSSERLILEAGRADRQYWWDLWRYRELFFILAWRDVAIRYKQTVIGLAWAFVRPFMTMVVFTIVFGKLAKLPTEGAAPYAVLVFAGLLPWTLASSILNDASSSVTGNAQLVSKVYFPRLIIPLATVLVGLIDFGVSLFILAGVMAWYGMAPDWHILLMPVFVVLAVLVAIGPALWAAAMIVKYRDFRFVIPFAVQVGLYVSPVGFSAKIIPQEWQLLYSLNPMVGVIDGFRWAILGGESPLYLPGFALSLVVTAFMLWFGIHTFRRTERGFADMI